MRLVHLGVSLLAGSSLVLALAGAVLGTVSCGDDFQPAAGGGGGTGGSAGSGGTGGDTGGSGGSAGSGGSDPCGGCSGLTPLCDTESNTCVACLGHGDCMDADEARCDDSGSCVACENSPECAGVSEGEVCLAGGCVECAVGEEDACSGQETCDLLANGCVDVAPESVGNCEACTNDDQCAGGHWCIPMEHESVAHGYYCLQAAPGCTRPFMTIINSDSINGAGATNYCGIAENFATCEAVLAVIAGWVCSGTPEMCGPDGQAEVPVPGASCETFLVGGTRCTYPCSTEDECPAGGGGATCGGSPPNDYCGG